MKKIFKYILAAIFVLLFLGTFVFLWQKTRPEKISYEIVIPQTDSLQKTVVATGKVEPRDEVLIKPQISGIIATVECEAGDMVKQGDVLATVKVIPEMSSLNSGEARVSSARINLEQQERIFNRTKGLFEKGILSKEEYEKDETTLKQSREEMQTAIDNLEIIKNGISKRYASMSNTQIRSTITGMLLNVPIKVGNSVIQSNTFNDGTTIATIADMSDMIFRGNIDETDIGKLIDSMPVNLTIGAIQGREFNATLEYISPKSFDDAGVVKFEIKAAVNIPSDVFVRAGFSANANIIYDKRSGVLTIPESTIEFSEGKSFVYVLTSEESEEVQTFERKEIKTGMSNGVIIEIIEGVTIEDKLRGNKKTS